MKNRQHTFNPAVYAFEPRLFVEGEANGLKNVEALWHDLAEYLFETPEGQAVLKKVLEKNKMKSIGRGTLTARWLEEEAGPKKDSKPRLVVPRRLM